MLELCRMQPPVGSRRQRRERKVARIAVNLTSADHDLCRGSLCLLVYIGVWLISVISVPVSLLLMFLGHYAFGGSLVGLMSLCFVIPIRPWQQLRKWGRRNLGRYFQEASVRFEHVPDPNRDRPTILCVNPHGVFSLSWAQCYLTDELHHFYFCFSTLLNLSPFFRIITRLTGYPSDVRKSTIQAHMMDGQSIALIPGGWHEATIHNDQIDRIYIKERTGFIKYAVQHGYTITPSYAFGERSTYSNLQGCYRFRFWLNGLGVLGVVPWGRPLLPMLPRSTRLHIVIARPVQLPYIPKPTPADVQRAHHMYMNAMIELFDRYKVQFYGEEAQNIGLELW